MLHRADSIDDDTVALQAANAARDRMRTRRLVTTDVCLKALLSLSCPFACIWGQEDVLYRGRWDQVRAACLGNTRCTGLHLVPDAGHWVQYEAADEFNRRMLAWLSP